MTAVASPGTPSCALPGPGPQSFKAVARDERDAGTINTAFAATPIVSGCNEPIAGGAAIGSLFPLLRTPWR
jgi:hypothetical protein